MGQLASLDAMQAEILAAHPGSKIRILAVNAVGAEAGNAAAIVGRMIPYLQDTEGVDAWGSWDVAWRDVVILDGENRALGVFNLTDRNLSLRPEYDALLNYLRLQAGE